MDEEVSRMGRSFDVGETHQSFCEKVYVSKLLNVPYLFIININHNSFILLTGSIISRILFRTTGTNPLVV